MPQSLKPTSHSFVELERVDSGIEGAPIGLRYDEESYKTGDRHHMLGAAQHTTQLTANIRPFLAQSQRPDVTSRRMSYTPNSLNGLN